jgi:RNA polymerase sigma factor (sigma-70 family)
LLETFCFLSCRLIETKMPDADFSKWIQGLAHGNESAVGRLWDRYYEQLIRLARRRLGTDGPQRVVGSSDVALSALNSFCEGVVADRFPRLDDPDDLWKVLVTLTVRKCMAKRKHFFAQKRHPGPGELCGESRLANQADSEADIGWAKIAGNEPSPELAAACAEQYQRLLDSLADDDLRQIAVLKLESYTNEEIACRLDCSLRTVKRRLAMIRQKWESVHES